MENSESTDNYGPTTLLHRSRSETELALSQAVASVGASGHDTSVCCHCVQDFLAALNRRDLTGKSEGLESGASDALPTADLRFYPAVRSVVGAVSQKARGRRGFPVDPRVRVRRCGLHRSRQSDRRKESRRGHRSVRSRACASGGVFPWFYASAPAIPIRQNSCGRQLSTTRWIDADTAGLIA